MPERVESDARMSGVLSRRTFGACCALLFVACTRPYRVGDFVLVEWGDEKLLYPAYIIAKKGNSRFRVHFDGYPARWDEAVTLDRIQGLVSGQPVQPPPPRHVQIATGVDKEKAADSTPLGRYKVDDRIRVKWRGSVYRAVVLEVVGAEKLKIHYDGHESAWDEVIHVSRIVTTPQ